MGRAGVSRAITLLQPEILLPATQVWSMGATVSLLAAPSDLSRVRNLMRGGHNWQRGSERWSWWARMPSLRLPTAAVCTIPERQIRFRRADALAHRGKDRAGLNRTCMIAMPPFLMPPAYGPGELVPS